MPSCGCCFAGCKSGCCVESSRPGRCRGFASVKSGGCSGLSYDLTFDNKQEENDKIFEENEVKIIVDKKSFLYLVGTTLEYSGGLNGKGFVFNNPNANRTCGCGESFSL